MILLSTLNRVLFLYEVDIIKTQHYEGFDFDLNGVLDGN